ncbi:hypothetical protein HOLleu_26525 [Holothuria leucospilota]|uniref:Uncharacterized protein n=1 Tax=Holothuria leucospilota TaxID=206669 RepID=A0A9Q1BP27_HOLLE|nr:hypothetical protein HOLleu_26525 [Holothuria leucospilota]
MDKIDMSLDDIIKQQKKEKAKQARKKAVLTKQYKRGGNKLNQLGVSPLNRTTIKPSSIVDGKKAYSARYIKPFQQNYVGRRKQGRGGHNRNAQVNGRLKQKANQRQFNQRRGLNTQVNTTKVRYQTKRVTVQTGSRGRGRANRGRGRQVNNAGRVQQTGRAWQTSNAVRGGQTVNRGRGRQAVNRGRGRQAVNRGRGRQPVNKGRLQQPIKTVKTKSQPAMLKVSINNTTNTSASNGPVKLKRNTFMNRKPSTLNERFSNFQRSNKQKQSNITQRTVLF